jgi:hypothetical protein
MKNKDKPKNRSAKSILTKIKDLNEALYHDHELRI